MTLHRTSRRHFLGALGLGTAGAALGVQPAAARLPRRNPAPIRLGVATYSLRTMDQAEAIAAVQALGVPYVSVKSFHLPYELSPAELAAGRRAFEAAGLQIVSGGNNDIREDTDEGVRPFFEYAKAAGIPMLVIAPTKANMPRIERFVKEYDIKVAIHNHGPEDAHFPGPADALAVIEGMDPRVGLCVDVGHTVRTGVDVVEAIAAAGDRVLDVHMKDLRDLSDRDSQCIVGEGAIPVAAVFRQLAEMGYGGTVNLEYEIHPDDPLPGMLQSMAYMRGVIAGLEEAGRS